MVHLSYASLDPLQSKTLQAWDKSVRENYENYQTEIDRTTYHLQRSQRGFTIFGSWVYPAFAQHYQQNLQILKLKQQLGRIEPEEVHPYRLINPVIVQHLNQSFNAKWYWPSGPTLIFTGGLQLFAQVFNFQYSWRTAFLIAPWALQVVVSRGSNSHAVPTLEFMNWLIEVRKSKARIEQTPINQELLQQYQKATAGIEKPLQDVYQDIIELAMREKPNL